MNYLFWYLIVYGFKKVKTKNILFIFIGNLTLSKTDMFYFNKKWLLHTLIITK